MGMVGRPYYRRPMMVRPLVRRGLWWRPRPLWWGMGWLMPGAGLFLGLGGILLMVLLLGRLFF
jgi:hypothetical protein